ncbi:ribosome small subunit-dependent GTPase A [Acetobacterium carbinolicum]|uniref:ribosome small subunit-dependent GTPase A n=1 Tax=Acetobacterium TaxID=33951 RepID=UPI000DBEC845|nr:MULTISPECIES: ribosome small subunit-dependent GTPase A [unclassified Acetobacterium]AWW25371.1 ribosome small subunit-dependent GTPase A [Acetobacterium sp. KB-1]MDK2941474.1 ribosome biosis GTPase / thiamine phosphate phosphatase [Acetobacterium sp.]MDZ5723881.1 ribosome small subunit-dependent GTPase A [Acetobacterium sp. K1/6]
MISNEQVTGKIIKGIGGFYYVKTNHGHEVLECKARGVLRHQKIIPTVGDEVMIQSDNPGEWMIESILPRKNIFIRPPVANVDIGLIVFSMTHPKPNLLLLDMLLISSEIQNVTPVVCFTKRDLTSSVDETAIKEIYEKTPYKLFFFSHNDTGTMDEIIGEIGGKTAFMAGPSGVGKSTMANYLCADQTMETGTLSQKLKRGKHTTRHVELLETKNGGFLLDTPGFSSYQISEMIKPEELREYFPEFSRGECRFKSCLHKEEPGCDVKEAVAAGKISAVRYEHYLSLLDEIKKDQY